VAALTPFSTLINGLAIFALAEPKLAASLLTYLFSLY
jgi:hypothetical protein